MSQSETDVILVSRICRKVIDTFMAKIKASGHFEDIGLVQELKSTQHKVDLIEGRYTPRIDDETNVVKFERKR